MVVRLRRDVAHAPEDGPPQPRLGLVELPDLRRAAGEVVGAVGALLGDVALLAFIDGHCLYEMVLCGRPLALMHSGHATFADDVKDVL